MAIKNSIDNIYSEYVNGFGAKMKSDDFCKYFIRCLQSGKNEMGITQKKVERKLGGQWLEMIEATVIPLDNIIRNPNRYIKNLEDIVPIELARGITDESIIHLAQHTNMIAKIDDDGMVTPDRILNITKEESFDTYENRFIYTLLGNLDYFIMRCLNTMNEGGKDITEVTLSGVSMVGREKIKYHMFFSCEGHSHVTESDHYELLNTDTTKLTVLQRVERVRKILFNFRETWLIKELKDCVPVRPPLHMTNALLHNPDFQQAVALWNFISNYRGDDVETTAVDSTVVPSDELVSDMFSLLPLQYSIIKNQLESDDIPVPPKTPSASRTKIRVAPLKEQIELFVDNADIDIREVRKIFLATVDKKEKERRVERTRIDNIVSHIMQIEQPWLKEEKARIKTKKEDRKKAELQKRLFDKEQKAKAKAEEKAAMLAAKEAEEKAKAEEQAQAEAAAKAAEEAKTETVEAAVSEAEKASELTEATAAVDQVSEAITAEAAEQAANDESVDEICNNGEVSDKQTTNEADANEAQNTSAEASEAENEDTSEAVSSEDDSDGEEQKVKESTDINSENNTEEGEAKNEEKPESHLGKVLKTLGFKGKKQ